jgi:glucose/arabinose dehydrogenase
MKRWIFGAIAICALAGLVLSNLNITRAKRGTALLPQQPETIASITLQPVLSGLSSPVGVYHANDESNRLFIVEQTGIIKVAQPGATTTTNFLNVTTLILSGGERGLLGLAFHPQYRTNGRFFIYYTKTGNGSLQVSEFHVSTANPNVADTTEIPLLNILHPTNSNHNGGMLAFGADGYLYIGPGDGGSGNDPPNNAQNINELKGKILRIDVDHPNGSIPYSSPANNPFFGATAGADEIWMVGMRNPWRFSFDRANPNQLWIGDVGQGAVEEIDSIDTTQNPTSGARNGGWRILEGNSCTNIDPCVQPANYIPPVAQYTHTGGRCSLTGGYVYRGRRGTFPQGTYVSADYCTSEIFVLVGSTPTVVLDADSNLTSFGEDEAGEIYACRSNGTVSRLVESTAAVPRNEIADFDGDLKSDISVYRGGTWYLLNSFTNSFGAASFGNATDRPVPGDYDGDGKADLAVWRDTGAVFYILNSSNNTFRAVPFGVSGDLPVQGDYDNDRKADIAVFRPSTGFWYYLASANGALSQQFFGTTGDQPVPGDYNGDGRNDFAVYRASAGQWFVQFNGGSQSGIEFGLSGDKPVAADYDGDGKTDIALFRPSTGAWYILRSSDSGLQSTMWGLSADVPVPADYDADGRDDIAVFRGGVWYIVRSSNGSVKFVSFGLGSDLPVPSAYKPQ